MSHYRPSISNKTYRIVLDELKAIGIHTSIIDEIIQSSGLTSYDIEKPNGRINEKNHHAIITGMYINKDISSIFFSSFSMMEQTLDTSYKLYPEIIGLCLNEKNIETAISSLVKYYSLISSCDNCTVRKSDDATIIEFNGFTPIINGKQNKNIIGIIGKMLNFVEMIYCYSSFVSLEVGFSNDYLPNKKRIDELFGTNCSLNQSSNYIKIKNSFLSIENNQFNERLYALQLNKINDMVIALSNTEQPLISNVKSMISDSILSKNISFQSDILNIVCDTLKISRWTLNRRLQAEGVCFAQVLNDAKLETSISLLKDSNLTIQEISDFLSFSTNSAFTRFFKNNVGQTPILYRTKYRNR